MKIKTHLQTENYTFSSNSNTRSYDGSLNHWIYTSSAGRRKKKKSTLLKPLWLRFRTTGAETFSGKCPRTALILAPGPQHRAREGSFHLSPGNTRKEICLERCYSNLCGFKIRLGNAENISTSLFASSFKLWLWILVCREEEGPTYQQSKISTFFCVCTVFGITRTTHGTPPSLLP